MKIEVEYKTGRVEVYKTSDESGLGSNVLARPRGEGYGNQTSAAIMLAPRFDLLETEGLRIDIMWYSPSVEDETIQDSVDDYPGGVISLPNMNFEIGRIWRVLDTEMLKDVDAISIDSRWHIERHGGFLVNTTQFLRQQDFLLSNEAKNKSRASQVVALHEYIRQLYPDWSDEEIARYYGYPVEAYLAAVKATMLGEEQEVTLLPSNDIPQAPKLATTEDNEDDADSDIPIEPLAGPRHAHSPSEVDYLPIMIQLLQTDPDLTPEDLVRELERRGAPVSVVKDAYSEAKHELNDIEKFVRSKFPSAFIMAREGNLATKPKHLNQNALLYKEYFTNITEEDEPIFDYADYDEQDSERQGIASK